MRVWLSPRGGHPCACMCATQAHSLAIAIICSTDPGRSLLLQVGARLHAHRLMLRRQHLGALGGKVARGGQEQGELLQAEALAAATYKVRVHDLAVGAANADCSPVQR